MKVARTVWTYTKTIRLVRDGEPVLLTATAGDAEVVIEETTVTVTVTDANKGNPVGLVTATFDKEVTLKSVMSGTTDLTERFITKFGETTTDKKYSGTVASTWEALIATGTEANVTVEDADGNEVVYTINLVILEPVSVTVKSLLGEVTQDELGVWEIAISWDNAVAAFPTLKNTDTLVVTPEGLSPIELTYHSTGNEFINLNIQAAGLSKTILEDALVTIK